MPNEDRTDETTQIAVLAALLDPAVHPQDELRGALRRCRGDVSRAAEDLLLPRIKSSGKRKAGTSLESWLGKGRDIRRTKPNVAELTDEDARRANSASSGNESDLLRASPEKPPSSRSNVITKDAFSLLKSAPVSQPVKPKAVPQPALLLTNQAAINKNSLPLTLLQSPLSPSFASALFLAMMEESETWDRHRWYLAGRWVESPHTSANFYKPGGGYGFDSSASGGESTKGEQGVVGGLSERDTDNDIEGQGKQSGNYYYSGNELFPPKPFPELLARAAKMIEEAVNASLAQHPRYPLEYAGRWRANMCGANRYDGAGSGVGWHADQLTYLGPYATIASFSLGTPRAFRLRPTDTVDPSYKTADAIRTYEVNLGHNSLVLMNGGCQERFKHTVPPQKALDLFRPAWDINERPILPEAQKTYTSRINITFRTFILLLVSVHMVRDRERLIVNAESQHQKAKARSKMQASPRKMVAVKKELDNSADLDSEIPSNQMPKVIEDDMVFFWQCQSPGNTGDLKGCGFFRILDMRQEGRGPCMIDSVVF